MPNSVKIVPSSSLIEITGSETTQSRFDFTGSALNIAYITPSQNDDIDVLNIKRKHPTSVTPGAGTSLGISYYGKSKSQNDLLFSRDIYTIQSTGSLGTDSVLVYKKSLYAYTDDILIEKKAPGIHEEFILSDGGINNEKFIRRTYVFSGTTVGPNQTVFLDLKYTVGPKISWISLNPNESAQITARIIGRAGGTGVRSRSFFVNGYADTLDNTGTIEGNYAVVNTTGEVNTAPPTGWNVQLQFVPDYLGGQTNYIRIQVFNNTATNETINWTAYVELVVDTLSGTVRYNGI